MDTPEKITSEASFTFPFKFEYKIKNWVDAKDTQGIWRLGRIVKKLDDRVVVTFDGWSEKYDQVLPAILLNM